MASAGGGNRGDRILAGCLILLIAFAIGNLLLFLYGRDQGLYAVAGRRMLQGRPPYLGSWDIKPPGIFLVYALTRAALGASMHAIRIVEAFGLASLVWAFAILSRRLVGDGRPGLIGAALGILSYAQLEFWHTAEPEGFGGICVVWAIVCATWRPDPAAAERPARQNLMWILSGALYGAAFLLKPPLGCGLAVSLWLIVRSARGARSEAGAARWIRPLACCGAGALIPVVMTLGYFTATGAMGAMREALLGFAPRYTQLNFEPAWFGELTFRAVEQWLFWFSPFTVPGLVCLLALPRLGPREPEGAAHLLGNVAFQLLGVALQGKFIPYHYAGSLPLAGLLAGWGLWKIWLRARRSAGWMLAWGAAAVLLIGLVTPTQMEEGPDYHWWPRCADRLRALASAPQRQAIEDRLYSHYDMSMKADRLAAAWVRARTAPGDAIFVWGFEPILYDLSDRAPASRYIQDQPLRAAWSRAQARPTLMEDLRRTPPAVIIVQHGDVLPLLTGDAEDSAAALLEFPELLSLIRSDYAPGEIIEGFELYVRRTAPR